MHYKKDVLAGLNEKETSLISYIYIFNVVEGTLVKFYGYGYYYFEMFVSLNTLHK